MSRIRPFRRNDLSQVVSLYEYVMRSKTRVAPPGLAEYFERTLFDHPWIDPEIPSLVYEDDGGGVAGFLGSHVRRLLLDARSIRLACSGQLVARPDAPNKAIGAFLLRTYLGGCQDATITDGATPRVRGIWEGLGGQTSHLRSIAWIRIFRPARLGGDYLLGRFGRRALARRLWPLWGALDALATRLVANPLRPVGSQASAEPLTAEALLEHFPSVTASLRGYPAYTESFLRWLFREMAEVKSRGNLVRALVRDSRSVIGWYVYYLKAGDISEVMQVVGKEGRTGEVLDHLLQHAYANGSAGVRGRLEPKLLVPLSRSRCILRYDGAALIHSRTLPIVDALLSAQCLLSRMDGEWWMGHHTEPFC